jgi:hypothetical protein
LPVHQLIAIEFAHDSSLEEEGFASVEFVEQQMMERGYLDSREMAKPRQGFVERQVAIPVRRAASETALTIRAPPTLESGRGRSIR